MGYFQRYGSIKPGPGLAQIDLEHPFGRALNFAMLFDQIRPLASGGPFTDMVVNGSSPSLIHPKRIIATFEQTFESCSAHHLFSYPRLNANPPPSRQKCRLGLREALPGCLRMSPDEMYQDCPG